MVMGELWLPNPFLIKKADEQFSLSKNDPIHQVRIFILVVNDVFESCLMRRSLFIGKISKYKSKSN